MLSPRYYAFGKKNLKKFTQKKNKPGSESHPHRGDAPFARRTEHPEALVGQHAAHESRGDEHGDAPRAG